MSVSDGATLAFVLSDPPRILGYLGLGLFAILCLCVAIRQYRINRANAIRYEKYTVWAKSIGGTRITRQIAWLDHLHTVVYQKAACCNIDNAVITTTQIHGCKVEIVAGDIRNANPDTIQSQIASFVALRLPGQTHGRCVISPHDIHKGMLPRYRGEVVRFESDAFNQRYRVFSSDKRWIYDILTPRMQDFLMSWIDPVFVDIDNGVCVVHSGSVAWDVETFRIEYEFLIEFFEHWPRHVVRQMVEATGS